MVIDELVAVLGYDVEGEQNLRRFQKGLDDLEKKARAFGDALGRTLAAAGAAAAAGFAALGKGVIDTGSTFENLGVRLEALEGSAEKGQRALDWIRSFAEETPLSLSEAADAYAKLRNFGIDPTNGSLQAAVDTMAMAGEGASYLEGIVLAMGQAWTKEKLQGEEALQLIERGVPVWGLLATALGKTVPEVQKLSEKGKLGRKEMTLLFEAMGKRAAGASQRMSKTWTGVVGRLRDRWEGFKKLIADSGAFDAAKHALEGFMDDIDAAFEDGRAQDAARSLSRAFIAVIDAFGYMAGRIKIHLRFLTDNIEKVTPIIKAFGAALALMLVTTFPVLSAIIALALAFEDFLTYLEGGESVIGGLIDYLKGLPGTLSGTAASIRAALSSIDWNAMGRQAGRMLVDGIVAGVGAGITAIYEIFVGLPRQIAAILVGLDWAAIWGAWKAAIGGINASIFALFQGAGARVAEIIKEWFGFDITAIGARLGSQLLAGIQSIGGQIAEWFASLVPEWAQGLLSGGNSRAAGGAGKNPLPGASGSPNIDAPAPDNVTPRGRGGALSPDRYMRKGEAQGEEPQWLRNFNGNLAKMEGAQATQTVVNDSSQDNRQYPVAVSAPVTVSVQQATQAPAAVGNAVSRAIDQGVRAQPSRMQQGPVQ